MKEISYREFQKQMCKLKGEDWLVYGRGGEIVGKWIAGIRIARHEEELEEEDVALPDNNARQDIEKRKSFLELRRKFGAGEFTGAKEVGGEYESVNLPKSENCGICESLHIVGYWSGWNEGEEVFDMPICRKCGAGKVGVKFKQI